MRIIILFALLLSGCAAMLEGAGNGLRSSGQSYPQQTNCYSHCYGGNCTTTCS